MLAASLNQCQRSEFFRGEILWGSDPSAAELKYVLFVPSRPLFSAVNNTQVMISNMSSLELSDGAPNNVTICASLPAVMDLDPDLIVTIELEIGMSGTGEMNYTPLYCTLPYRLGI